MSDGSVALILAVVFIASAILYARRRSARGESVERGLPAELRGAEIAFAERTFRSHRHRLVARLDRAYRTRRGIELVEFKTRPRDIVYLSDVIELSVQRIALEDETGEPVSDEAWVVVQNSGSGKRRPHKVCLVAIPDIAAMRERYTDLLQGRVRRPAPALSPSQCRHCAHNERCAAWHEERA